MSMTPDELQRKVRQNDEDVQAVLEIVSVIRAQQTRHLHRLDGVEQRLTERIDGLDSRFDGIDTVLTEILRRLPEPS